MTIEKWGIKGMIEWDMKFKDTRGEYVESGPSAEIIERNRGRNNTSNNYGLCNSCYHVNLIESDSHTLYSSCNANSSKYFRPSKIFPVTKRSSYWNVNHLQYAELQNMAWIIDVKNNKVGFIKPDED